MKRQIAITLALGLSLFGAAVFGGALGVGAQEAPEHAGGVASCTTDTLGYCTVGHNLGAVPTDVQVTPASPIGGPDIPAQMVADQATATTFRVRALHTNGTPLNAVAITFWYHAWVKLVPATTSATTTSTTLPAVSAKLVPAKGAWWGDYVSSDPNQVLAREALSGRKFDIIKQYEDRNNVFPDATEKSLADGGRFLMYAWEVDRDFSNAANNLCWSQITAGAADADIDRVAANLKAFGKPLFLAIINEPDGAKTGVCDAPRGVFGTAAENVAMNRYVHDRLVAKGATNAVFVMAYGGSNLTTVAAEYPGDAYVDWIGWDPYNWYNCRGHNDAWTQLGDKMARFYNWAQLNHPNKPLMLPEYGSQQPTTAAPSKGDWMRQAAVDVPLTRPAVRAYVYFDRQDSDCAWRVDSSADATAGWKDMGQAAYFNQPHA